MTEVKETETDNKTNLKCLFKFEKIKNFGETIGKITSNHYFTKYNSKVLDIADDLEILTDTEAVCVTNSSNEITGIIIRKNLFDFLCKPFGRDLYFSKTAGEICQKCGIFDNQSNIYSIAEEIEGKYSLRDNNYFAISNKNKFAGIFSTQDLLIYLSSITQKDIQLARKLQSNIVKEDLIFNTPSFDLCAANRSAKGVSGDFYDVREYTKNKWLFSLCDVSGKGISASLVTAAIGGLFSSYDFRNGVSSFIECMNNFILSTFGSEKFVTGMFIDYCADSGEARIYDMGHSFLYLFRSDRFFRLKTFQENNIPLGILGGKSDFFCETFIMKPGDLLITVSDGIIEQINEFGEQYGTIRLAANIGRNRRDGTNRISAEILKDIHSFRGKQSVHDDMTMLLLDIKDLIPN